MPAPAASSGFDAAAAAAAIREFLARRDEVWLREDGAVVARLRAADSGFALQLDAGKLVAHFWTAEANLVRRIVDCAPDARRPDQLRLRVRRLGRTQPSLLTLETAGAEDAGKWPREQFRQLLVAACERQWPGWKLVRQRWGQGAGLQTLWRRGTVWAACAGVAEEQNAAATEAALAAALAWTRQVHTETPLAALWLVLPVAAYGALSARLAWLKGPPRLEYFVLDRSAAVLEPAPLDAGGNLESTLCRALGRVAFTAVAEAWLERVRAFCPDARLDYDREGRWRVCLHGLDILQQAEGPDQLVAEASFGCGRERSPLTPAAMPLCERFLAQLRDQRHAGGFGFYYNLQPERWMESLLRGDLGCVAPRAHPAFAYSQVPACGGGRRDILDLLGVDRDGRLLVCELKAGEDAAFPLQALDYWLRVRQHLATGDFERLGYFPGVALSPLPPRLLLIAPALRWHPNTRDLLAWLGEGVPVERIGVNEEWRRGLKVVARW